MDRKEHEEFTTVEYEVQIEIPAAEMAFQTKPKFKV